MSRKSPLKSLSLALLATGVALLATLSAHAAGSDRPDFRIRFQLRTPDNGAWGANESVGNAEFRVQSRYMQVYYGGVRRSDEYKFVTDLDFTGISGFETEFASSPYNTSYDVYIEGGFVGRFGMNGSTGLGALEYDSRHPDPPALPLPSGFPDPVDVGMVVSIFFASGPVPAVGDAAPAGTPVFSGALAERDARGDVNQDGKVDLDDFDFLAANYDPSNAFGPHVGPFAGDFTGDNRSDLSDYALFVLNWTESTTPPSLSVAGVGDLRVGGLQLAPNSPNPFRGSTTLRFALPRASDVTVDIVDIAGARVARLERSGLSAGPHEIVFDGRDASGRQLPNGAYFYRVTAGGDVATRRMVLMQ